jgi:hypothetical protein
VAGGIFLRRDGDLVQMSERGYTTESDLQRLLARHPDLLSGDGQPRRWLLVSREFGIASEKDGSNRWSVDHLFLDEGAVPTLVEVKRSTDTRIRREVVGQMLDYAANALSYWQLETVRARFEAECATDPAEVLVQALGPDTDPDDFWEMVRTNLAGGRVRLIFVADVIPAELRAIVEFLNHQMSPAEVLAVEVRQYVDDSGEHQTLVPKIIGDTQAARRAKSGRRRRRWDHNSWLAAYREARGADQAAVVERLLIWASEHDPPLEIGFGTAARDPGAMVRIPTVSTLFGLYPRGGGRVEIHFGYLKSMPPFDDLQRRRELQARLQAIPDVSINDGQLDKYPSFPVGAIADPARLQQFIDTIDWVIAEAFPPARGGPGP